MAMIFGRLSAAGLLGFIFHAGCFLRIAEGTEQQMDPLFWKGEEIVHATGPNFEGAPVARRMNFEPENTANYKGYTAIWEIKEDILYLRSISGRIDGKETTVADFFPGRTTPIAADWYSGTIIIAAGNELGRLKRDDFRWVYATEIHLSVEKGKVMEKTVKRFPPNSVGIRRPGDPIAADSPSPDPGEPIPARAFRD